MTIQPPKKLPSELESFETGAGDKGVVIFSLGTLGDAILPKHHVEHLAAAFWRLEKRVVWRLRSKWNKNYERSHKCRLYSVVFQTFNSSLQGN